MSHPRTQNFLSLWFNKNLKKSTSNSLYFIPSLRSIKNLVVSSLIDYLLPRLTRREPSPVLVGLAMRLIVVWCGPRTLSFQLEINLASNMDEKVARWCIVFVFIFQCVLVVMCINCQLRVQLQSDLLLVFGLVSVLNGWDCMCAQYGVHAAELPCMRPTTLLNISALCQLLGWIYNLYECSFICECMLCPLLYLFLLQLILSLLKHIQLLLCFVLCLQMIFMLRCHLIARVSKVAFIASGSNWYCNFILLCIVNNLPLAYIASGMLPSAVCYHVVVIIPWCPCLWTTWYLHG